MKRIIRRNNGFSLIELLIVIAIIGVLAVIAFSMFTSVIHNSRKKSDEHQALVIEKAVISYMLQSRDTKLEHLRYATYSSNQSMHNKKSEQLIYALQNDITCNISGKDEVIYPILNPKSGSLPSTSGYTPFWNTTNGGKYVGYKIEVDSANLSCHVTPVESDTDAYVYVK